MGDIHYATYDNLLAVRNIKINCISTKLNLDYYSMKMQNWINHFIITN